MIYTRHALSTVVLEAVDPDMASGNNTTIIYLADGRRIHTAGIRSEAESITILEAGLVHIKHPYLTPPKLEIVKGGTIISVR